LQKLTYYKNEKVKTKKDILKKVKSTKDKISVTIYSTQKKKALQKEKIYKSKKVKKKKMSQPWDS
jgi:hypothetical protein